MNVINCWHYTPQLALSHRGLVASTLWTVRCQTSTNSSASDDIIIVTVVSCARALSGALLPGPCWVACKIIYNIMLTYYVHACLVCARALAIIYLRACVGVCVQQVQSSFPLPSLWMCLMAAVVSVTFHIHLHPPHIATVISALLLLLDMFLCIKESQTRVTINTTPSPVLLIMTTLNIAIAEA